MTEVIQRYNRSFLTPAAYTAAFQEGADAYKANGKNVTSPYLELNGYKTIMEETRATAWESGWWSEALADPNFSE